MPVENAQQMAAIVQAELDAVTDPEILSALRSGLISPKQVQYDWVYGASGDTYPCWVVLEHIPSGTGIAYSDFGFGLRTPWGLIWLSSPSSGDDSGWFSTLEDAFSESRAEPGLRIWDILKRNVDGSTFEIAEVDLTSEEAMEKQNQLNAPWRNNPTTESGHATYFAERRTKHRKLD